MEYCPCIGRNMPGTDVLAHASERMKDTNLHNDAGTEGN